MKKVLAVVCVKRARFAGLLTSHGPTVESLYDKTRIGFVGATDKEKSVAGGSAKAVREMIEV